MTETLLNAGKIVLIAYLAVVALAYFMQDGLIFYPQPLSEQELQAISARHPLAQAVRIPAGDGITLQGWYLRSEERVAGRAPLIIYFGGNAEEVSWLLGESARFGGYSLLLMNYRGYGGSGGKPGEAAMQADALRIYDDATGRADVDRTHIVLMGRSLGTALAAHVAARRSARGVLLVSPFDSMADLAQRHYPFLPASWLLRHRFAAIADAARIDAPLFTLVAANDGIIPEARSRRLYEAWHGPRTWRQIEGAGHNDVSDKAGYWQAIGEFLAEMRR